MIRCCSSADVTSREVGDSLPAQVETLLQWGQKHGRHFPWRKRRGYELAVAEILLQKTKGAAVVAVWNSLLTRYPDPGSLAQTTPGAVECLVGSLGLGTQRSKRLVAVAARMAGETTSSGGLGQYGEGVLILAEGGLAAPVDGNIARVMTRLLGLSFSRGEARKKPEVRQAVTTFIESAPPASRLDLVYALVDLGALVCLPRRPICGGCPLQVACSYGRS